MSTPSSFELVPKPTLSHDLLVASLRLYHEDTLAAWKVALNRFVWPEHCPVPAPPGFADAATDRERMALAAPLWHALTTLVSARAFSKAWHTMHLGKTEAEWQAWWATTGEALEQDLRLYRETAQRERNV